MSNTTGWGLIALIIAVIFFVVGAWFLYLGIVDLIVFVSLIEAVWHLILGILLIVVGCWFWGRR